MFQVPLVSSPNQALSFSQDGSFWQVRIYQSVAFMCMDITRDGVPIINGVRCFAAQPVMPYDYMWKPNFGNLMFDSNPDWTNFGSTCNLYYMSQSEIATVQAALLATQVH